MRRTILFLYFIFTATLIKADKSQVFDSDKADLIINYFESNQIDELILHYWQSNADSRRRFMAHVKNVILRKAEKVGSNNLYEIELTGITSNNQTLKQNLDLATVYIKMKGKATHLCELLRFDCEEVSAYNSDWNLWIILAEQIERDFLENQKVEDSIKKQEQIEQESRLKDSRLTREKDREDKVMLIVVLVFVFVVIFIFKRYRKNKKAANLIETQKREERIKQEAEKAAIQKKEEDIRYAKYLEDKRKQEEADRAETLEKERKLEEERKKQEQERLAKELAHKKQLEEERKKQEEVRIAKDIEEKKKLEEERIAKELTAKKKQEEEKKRQEEERIEKEAAEKKKKEEERLRLEEERSNNGYFIEVEENNAFVIKGPFTQEEIKSKLEKGEIVLTTMMKKGIKTVNLRPLHTYSEFNAGLDGFL